MTLVEITKSFFLLQDNVNCGLIKTSDSSAVIIDTGIDKSSANKIIKILDENGIKEVAVINTHAHADHYGGNNQIIKRYKEKCMVYASEFEETIIQNSYLEPYAFFSGANPISDLKNKFIMAQNSKVDVVIKKEESFIEIFNTIIGIVKLPGHSVNQIGVSHDGVLYLGDSIFEKTVLEKHKIPFLHNVKEYLETLEFIENSDYEYFLGAHIGIIKKSQIKECIDYHKTVIERILEDILKICEDEKESKEETKNISVEKLIKKLLDLNGLEIKNVGQYFLMKSAILAFISHLCEIRKIKMIVKDNNLLIEEITE